MKNKEKRLIEKLNEISGRLDEITLLLEELVQNNTKPVVNIVPSSQTSTGVSGLKVWYPAEYQSYVEKKSSKNS